MSKDAKLTKEVKDLIGRRTQLGEGDDYFGMMGEGSLTTAY